MRRRVAVAGIKGDYLEKALKDAEEARQALKEEGMITPLTISLTIPFSLRGD